MKKVFLVLMLLSLSLVGCDMKPAQPTADASIQKQTEQQMIEANRQAGMPAIVNFQEKKNLKWIYELCDQENLTCHAYFFNELKGELGAYIGPCIGYGIPYSTQYSNPDKFGTVDGGEMGARNPYTMAQPEPNGLFKPEGMSATWLLLIDPSTNKPRPVYFEPTIIVSPFKLK